MGSSFDAMNTNLSSQELRRAADLKERIEALQAELSALLGAEPKPSRARKRYISFEARARMAAATRVRLAKLRVNRQGPTRRKPGRRSAAVRAKLAAIARARWRRAKAAGKNAL